MDVKTYLAIALVWMAHDAVSTHEAKIYYRWAPSMVLAMLWPVTSVLLILGVMREDGAPPPCEPSASPREETPNS